MPSTFKYCSILCEPCQMESCNLTNRNFEVEYVFVCLFVCLFVSILYVPVNTFSVVADLHGPVLK